MDGVMHRWMELCIDGGTMIRWAGLSKRNRIEGMQNCVSSSY